MGGPVLPELGIPVFIRVLASPLGAIMIRFPPKPAMERSQARRMGHGAFPVTLSRGAWPCPETRSPSGASARWFGPS